MDNHKSEANLHMHFYLSSLMNKALPLTHFTNTGCQRNVFSGGEKCWRSAQFSAEVMTKL